MEGEGVTEHNARGSDRSNERRDESASSTGSKGRHTHEITLAVWDIPSPVVMSRQFKVKVGVKCSAGCQLTGKEVEVHTETGGEVASASLGETPWVGTGALYWAEVDLAAPAAEGQYFWSVRFAAADLEVSHGGASASLSFRTIKPPEHSVLIKVIDKETEAPVQDVAVRLGFYRTSTDESGLAKVEVPKGTYDLSLWKVGYEALPRTVEVTEDVSVHVEILVVPEPPEPYWM